jgi:uncharacterized protein (TIGR02453 family)
MAFDGFPADALPFFKALAFHQTKEWFEANRALYISAVKAPLEALVEELDAACKQAGLPFSGNPKKNVYRIHRDVRFSKNKNPYKTNGGFGLYAGTDKAPHGIFYFHLDPTGCFMAAGSYMPEPARLLLFRRSMAAHPERFLRIVEALAQTGLSFDTEMKLTRPPQGFAEADARVAEFLKLKSFTSTRPLDSARLADGAWIKAECLRFMQDTMPLTEFVRAVG